MKCPKCQGEMEKGIIKPEGSNFRAQQWGKETDFLGRLKTGKTLETYRYISCGFVESYAK